MEDLFKKFVYTGVGLVAMTAEKLQETIDGMVDEGKLSKEEGRKVVDDLMEATESKREEFEEKIKSFTEKVIESLNLPTRKEVESLKAKVASLEAELEAQSKKTTRTPAKRTTVKKATDTKKKSEG